MKWAVLIIHTTTENHNVVVLELADEDTASEVAAALARETGRCVSVTDENLTLLKSNSAASFH